MAAIPKVVPQKSSNRRTLKDLLSDGKKLKKKAIKSIKSLLAGKKKKKLNYNKRVDIYAQGQKRKKIMEATGNLKVK